MSDLQASHSRNERNENLGGVSRGREFSIVWAGSSTPTGAEVIDVLRACLDRSQAIQKTNSASTKNEKLIYRMMQAIEEYDGKAPSIGGDLLNLIPPKE